MRWKIAAALVFAFVGTQFIQPVSVAETAPHAPVFLDTGAPDTVVHIIDKSCRDCHSSSTVWPWYSRISPISWFVARDVERGRRFLNFSEWARYSDGQKMAYVAAMASAANQDRMPPRNYLLMHPDARLTDQDRQVLKGWSRLEFRRLSALKRSRQNRSTNGS